MRGRGRLGRRGFSNRRHGALSLLGPSLCHATWERGNDLFVGRGQAAEHCGSGRGHQHTCNWGNRGQSVIQSTTRCFCLGVRDAYCCHGSERVSVHLLSGRAGDEWEAARSQLEGGPSTKSPPWGQFW